MSLFFAELPTRHDNGEYLKASSSLFIEVESNRERETLNLDWRLAWMQKTRTRGEWHMEHRHEREKLKM